MPVQIVGVIPVTVSLHDKSAKLNLYVTNIEREPLLGRKWIQQLPIRLTESINQVHPLHNEIPNKIERLLQQYRNKLDPNSTKIKGCQARLLLKEDVRPVFLKARTVPFKLLPLVEEELQTLVQTGVLEKVKASQWATPIVPMLKRDNAPAICQREIEAILGNINGLAERFVQTLKNSL
ncbi:Uncharacterized protein K02A2.6 [Trachymyrmex cornetzi]|uniref:Uncharacterized protein K02A2.6 n=1 Tax=Trachymyrmex cornetzi TaxID=471704 RepID=A0A151IZU5_9HYME|nr:Uncharacterized protein K02A2.6 [Trachymyrmex cornetzi]